MALEMVFTFCCRDEVLKFLDLKYFRMQIVLGICTKLMWKSTSSELPESLSIHTHCMVVVKQMYNAFKKSLIFIRKKQTKTLCFVSSL
jgi:hypothetical protein